MPLINLCDVKIQVNFNSSSVLKKELREKAHYKWSFPYAYNDIDLINLVSFPWLQEYQNTKNSL